MVFTETNPLPEICQKCTEAECCNCDYALARWPMCREYELETSRELKLRAIARLRRQITQIDRELEELKK